MYTHTDNTHIHRTCISRDSYPDLPKPMPSLSACLAFFGSSNAIFFLSIPTLCVSKVYYISMNKITSHSIDYLYLIKHLHYSAILHSMLTLDTQEEQLLLHMDSPNSFVSLYKMVE